MGAEKAKALVLRLTEFSESSCVVTLFTREHGKIGALAKGARRAKAPFDSALDLLSLCRIVFLRKSSGGLDLLTEAKLERRFRPPSRDMSTLYAAYYVADLLLALTVEYDPHPELFDLTETTLAALASDAEVVPAIVRYELIALRLLGHMPNLDECSACGEQVPAQGRIAFGLLSGGVLCGKCRHTKKQVVSLSAGTLRMLRLFAEIDSESWRRAKIQPSVRAEMRGVLNQYFNNLVGRRLKTQRYLEFAGP